MLGTAFQDVYDFYLSQGDKVLTLYFREPHHRIDLLTNGLRIFTFCVGDTGVLSSLLQTTKLYMGGFGMSKFIPFVGSRIPDYMMKANVNFLERFTLDKMEKRVI